MNKQALHKQRTTPRRYNLEVRHNYSLCRGWVYVCMPPQCVLDVCVPRVCGRANYRACPLIDNYCYHYCCCAENNSRD